VTAKLFCRHWQKEGKTEDLKVTLMTGASLGHGTDGKLAEANVLKKRMPFR
jgi:acetyl-CoA hydrolase/succinyl-CoA:acetate CoA-transferase